MSEIEKIKCGCCEKDFPVMAMRVSVITVADDVISPYKVGKKYHVCYRCFLSKLGVNPNIYVDMEQSE